MGSKARPTAAIVVDWLSGCEDVLLSTRLAAGLASKLLAESLQGIGAGERLAAMPIHSSGARPMSTFTVAWRSCRWRWPPVGLHGPLLVLGMEYEASTTGCLIPDGVGARELEQWRVIEVYPSATRIAHGAPGRRLLGRSG